MDSEQFIRNNLSAHRVLEIKSNQTKYDGQLVLPFALIERGYSVGQRLLGPFMGVVVEIGLWSDTISTAHS
jgi:hypothetical protein